jgi:Tol biopolymer transport system component
MERLKSLVLIDAAVEKASILIAGVKTDIEAILLHSHQDGVAQITKILSSYKKIASLHIISHGNVGSLQLGNTVLDLQALQNPQIQTDLKQWKTALVPGSEILLYGCEIAAGILGKTFVNQLSRFTGAKIAASETKIGNAALGGNWELEYQAGQIQSSVPFHQSVLATYSGILTTERVSIASDGTQSNYGSYSPSISGNGRYVAFSSDADNLVAGDTNWSEDIFVYDRKTDQTRLISVASDGTGGNDNSKYPSISDDGRYVAFSSDADNLVVGDTNWSEDIFVYDRKIGQTCLISVASDGTQGNLSSYSPSISADGRYVAFGSSANNLVAGDIDWYDHIFVHDRKTGTTTRVSVASDGTQSNSYSYSPSISANGRYITFMSWADNLIAGDMNGLPDIFVHDQNTGQTSLVSLASDGTYSNSWSYSPSISADGRYVAFASSADNLVAGDTNGTDDIFVHDRKTGTTTRVSVASDGTQSTSYSSSPSISNDGRYITFMSYADNLVVGDTNGFLDIFVHDRNTGQTSLVSVSSDTTLSNSWSYSPSISANGHYVTFASSADNLVAGDTNGTADIFVHILNTSTTASVGDKVWNDSNVNGIQDPEESGIAGISVQLFDSSNTLIADTITNVEGLYHFNDLDAGNYLLKFVPPADYAFTMQDAGTNDSFDSDADIITGQTAVTLLKPGEKDLSWDAGLYQVKFTGTKDADTLIGNDGHNMMTGLAGNDKLIGNDGNDTLDGGIGIDTMIGGLGDDLYMINTNGDRVIEKAGQGIDHVHTPMSDTLGNQVENLTLIGNAAITGTGNGLANTITGNNANNTLNGLAGHDTLIGQGGHDTLNGGVGNDTLNGGAGNDLLTGGISTDSILYSTGTAFKTADIGMDRINGFVSGTDQIVLSQTTFAALTSIAGIGFSIASEFTTVLTNRAVATSEALIVYNTANGRLFYNENGAEAGLGSGGVFATLTTIPTIKAEDFLLIA